jgi:hypothetical protein
MAEDHREDETQRHGVQRRVAPGVAGQEAAHQAEQAGEAQPGVAGEQAVGDEAGEARAPHVALGDVVTQQPGGQRQQAGGEQRQAGLLVAQRGRGAGQQQADDEQEHALRIARDRQEAIEFEALAGDGQHQEGQPPGHGEMQFGAGDTRARCPPASTARPAPAAR